MILSATLEEIIFQNEDNGYLVGLFETDEMAFVAVGFLPSVSIGDKLELSGDFGTSKYGDQFSVESFRYLKVLDEDEMRMFFRTAGIKGLGPALAERIVDAFGSETFEILEKDPKRLLEVAGVGKKTLERIQRGYYEIKGHRDALLFLQQMGLSPARVASVLTKYADETIGILKNDPYRLYYDFPQLGFSRVDEMAKKLGFEPKSPQRIAAFLLSRLYRAQENGHVYLEKEDLLRQLSRELQLAEEEAGKYLRDQIISGLLMEEDGAVYIKRTYIAETYIARDLLRLMHSEVQEYDFETELQKFQERKNIVLDELQIEAFRIFAKHPVTLITGGPGTGKTTLIRAMVDYAEVTERKIELAAPTGRAAKRIEEATLHEARTIHRLLEYKFSEDQNLLSFERNRLNPLETQILILDEVSMVDQFLMQSVLEALDDGTRLVLIGDADQLASVGPGKVLHDLLKSETIPTVKLQHIFRQSEHSLIPLNAERVIRGQKDLCLDGQGDFFLMREHDPKRLLQTLVSLVTKRLPEHYGFDPLHDIQVLTPLRKGNLGTGVLNEVLQKALLGTQGEAIRGFREGDKVMQTKNDYELAWKDLLSFAEGKGVFNGDIGEITEVDLKKKAVTVVFERSREVRYDWEHLPELDLAYAMTIHKAQGSEFPCVIVVLGYVPDLLLNRNVLYTGFTRAKQLLIVLGNTATLSGMIENVDTFERNTALKQRLIEYREVAFGSADDRDREADEETEDPPYL